MTEIELQICQMRCKRSNIVGVTQITSANGSNSCFQLLGHFITSVEEYKNKHLGKF